VLVYFGYPQAHEDDAERAVRAGLELIQAVGELKSSAHLQTRVGIATGIVVVGDRPPNASELAINFKRRELEETCRQLDGLIERSGRNGTPARRAKGSRVATLRKCPNSRTSGSPRRAGTSIATQFYSECFRSVSHKCRNWRLSCKQWGIGRGNQSSATRLSLPTGAQHATLA
jgi:hypothetical protein